MIMNKKLALVTLLEASLMLTAEEKLDLIDAVPGLNDRQVDALGVCLARERELVLANEPAVMSDIQKKLDDIANQDEQRPDTIYVGVGKPS